QTQVVCGSNYRRGAQEETQEQRRRRAVDGASGFNRRCGAPSPSKECTPLSGHGTKRGAPARFTVLLNALSQYVAPLLFRLPIERWPCEIDISCCFRSQFAQP